MSSGAKCEEAGGTGRGPITETVDQIAQAAEAPDFSVRRFVEELGNCSFAHMLLWPALIVVTPLSGIPGLSSMVGITIAIIAMQMVVGRSHLWLPDWILRQKLPRERFRSALAWLRRPVGAIDRVTRARLQWVFTPPLREIIQVCCMLSGIAMPLLELVPMTSSILGAAVALFAISLITEDGLLALGGLLAMSLAGLLVSGLFAGA